MARYTDNEEKEINEHALEIYTLFRSRPMSKALARRLYEKGWRKQSEGEWEFEFTLDNDDFYKWSVCGRQEVINGLCKERNPVEHYPYCHCGAKMKGGE